jgi:hypothetical protein
MLEQRDSSSKSSTNSSSLASDVSERDFHASDAESFVASDVSHLCSISELEGLSESDSKASYQVPGDQATTERSSEASNLGGENDIFRAKNLIVEQPGVDEGGWTDPFLAADQSPTIHSTIISVNFYQLTLKLGGILLVLFSCRLS